MSFPRPYFKSLQNSPTYLLIYHRSIASIIRCYRSSDSRMLLISFQDFHYKAFLYLQIDHFSIARHKPKFQTGSKAFPCHSFYCTATNHHTFPHLDSRIFLAHASYFSIYNPHTDSQHQIPRPHTLFYPNHHGPLHHHHLLELLDSRMVIKFICYYCCCYC
jgi:hypothetical protein